MLTAEAKAARRTWIGSSDSPAILGVDPYRNRHDVYLDKVHELDDFTTPAIEAGNLLEPVLIDWCGQQLGRPIRSRGSVHNRDVLGCTLDADFSDTEIVEAKTTGLVDQWGEAGTDEVPDKVLVQTHHAMWVTGAVVAYVPVILAKFGLKFALYTVERNDKIADAVVNEAGDFWTNNVLKRVPPVGPPSLDVVKRIKRQPSSWCDVPDEIVQAWQEANEARKAAEKIEESAKAAVLAAMGTNEGARCGLGLITNMEQKRAGYVAKPATYRVLKLKGSQ